MDIALMVRRRRRAGGWSPLKLPNLVTGLETNRNHLFQDVAGQTPATEAGDPIALEIDPSQGVKIAPGSGPLSERITGLGPDTNSAANTISSNSTITPNGSGFDIVATGNYGGIRDYTTVREVGRWYLFRVTWSGNTKNHSVVVKLGTASDTTISTAVAGTAEVLVQCSVSNQMQLFLTGSQSGDTAYLRVDSIRAVPGAHAAQTIDDRRPKLAQSGAVWGTQFDGIDDRMPLPNDLRSVFTGSQQFTVAVAFDLGTQTYNWPRIFDIYETIDGQRNSVDVIYDNTINRLAGERHINGVSTKTVETVAPPSGKQIVILRWDGSNLRWDGNQTITTADTRTGPAFTSAAVIHFGRLFVGSIYRSYIWNRALTDAEVAEVKSHMRKKVGV